MAIVVLIVDCVVFIQGVDYWSFDSNCVFLCDFSVITGVSSNNVVFSVVSSVF